MTAKLAEVHTLYESNASDVASMLTKMADRIRAQDSEDDVTEAVISVEVSASGAIRIFGFGRTEIFHSIGVLSAAASHLSGNIEDGDDV